jgi:hypothetical protein
MVNTHCSKRRPSARNRGLSLSLSLSLLVTHTHIHTHTHSHTLTLTLKLTHTLSLSLSLTHTHIHRADAGSEYSKDGRLGSKSTCFERCSAHYPRRCQRGYVSSYASYYYYCHFVHLRTRERGWGEVEGRDSETGRERERIRGALMRHCRQRFRTKPNPKT